MQLSDKAIVPNLKYATDNGRNDCNVLNADKSGINANFWGKIQ